MEILSLRGAQEIKETVLDDAGDETEITYELKAIVNHHGEGLNFGHYHCYAKRLHTATKE